MPYSLHGLWLYERVASTKKRGQRRVLYALRLIKLIEQLLSLSYVHLGILHTH